MPSSLERVPALARFLKGDPVGWNALGIAEKALLALCDAEDLGPLVYLRLAAAPDENDAPEDAWPASVRAAFSRLARDAAAAEMLLGAEVRAVVADLAKARALPVLIKGTPLAYSVYDAPACRPRNDTDLLVREQDVEAARAVFAARGYAETVNCDGLFSQFEVQRTDRFGVLHVFDVHWKISTQPVFAGALTYDELLARAEPLAALGPQARAAGPVDALFLACLHPVMHHRGAARALWLYDIHLLASRLSAAQFESFVEKTRQTQMAAVCARELGVAQRVFQTAVPEDVLQRLQRLAASGEPSSAYLADDRRWHDELVSSVRGLRSWRDRVRLVRHVLLPEPRYMLGAYGLGGTPMASLLLPALYVHRNVHGAWKVLTGKK